jgi:GNAT superfamily N-acetyltransferase
MSVVVRRCGPEDTPQIRDLWIEQWGGDIIVVHGVVYRPQDVQAFIAMDGGQWVGIVTYARTQAGFEIVTLDSLRKGQGIGSRLVEEVTAEARRAGCPRIFLITTNDNLEALGFYQRRGFQLAALHIAALEQSRKIKPGISLIGLHGIPLRDEIELEMIVK